MFSFLRKMFSKNKKIDVQELDEIDLDTIHTNEYSWFVNYVPPCFFRENKEYLSDRFKDK